ncbi:transcription factor Tfb4 [Martensiomyces pterosporus]|nr:transcription factor Tfb4 [Martensiomyces pterosporus]
MAEPAETDASLLVVILDVNASAWEKCPLKFDNALQQVVIFINAYLALKPENELAVLAVSKTECKFLYPRDYSSDVDRNDIQVYEQFRVVDTKVLSAVQAMCHSQNATARSSSRGIEESQSLVSQALSKALCHVNRSTKSTLSKKWPRILVLSAADDSPREYIALMNSIFAAQKMNVLIDICKVFGRDSVFLQQAAEITGGNYLKIDTQAGESLLQSLMFTCLADHYTREILYSPCNDLIDFRATCFCHKKVVDIGYVCSVCLSIFCKMAPVCSTCKTKFTFRLVRTSSSGRPNGQGSQPRTAAVA